MSNLLQLIWIFSQKFIIAFALIAAVSCDVSHIVQGDGWYKDESGYHYTEPAAKFDEVAIQEVVVADAPAEPILVSEPLVVEAPVEIPAEPVVVADEPVQVEVAEPELVAEVHSDPISEVVEVVEVPVNNLREYLPPVVTADAKKKRQIPVRRVIRKVYRRFVPVKRH